ncbi:MAG: PIN domain-containing protein [Candidatus Rokubacteria bacterium]|nr:PIN domain-containing protein [Candidatus Rokubacteria bacterium]
MSHLLDVSVLIACGWKSHADHRAARRWLDAQANFHTCPLTQLGFLRISISPAFRATFEDARSVLEELTGMKGARFLPDTLPGTVLPPLQSANDVSDAYFVALADAAQLRLATLDDDLCRKPWAAGIAVNPLRSR